jgi:hypothetical protein
LKLGNIRRDHDGTGVKVEELQLRKKFWAGEGAELYNWSLL